MAATNGIGIVSGLAAFVNTNTLQNFASNNAFASAISQINTSSNLLNGQINTSSNLTFGNALTQINTTSNLLEQQIVAGGITAAVGTNIAQTIANTSSNLVYGNALTQINTTSNSVVNTGQTSVNTASNSVYGTLNSAKADKTITVTLAGTANQINSSAASAQPLSGNVASTLSLPSTLILPGTLNVTGNQTNQGTLSVTGNATNFGTLTVVGNLTAPNLVDASTLTSNHHVSTGATTNLVSSEDATGYTNTVAYTHEGTGTNINIVFNGTLQSFTVTNGPDVWLNWSGANGSVAVQILTNCHVHSSTVFNKFLAGSNGVSAGVYQVTNGYMTVTSAGGTNGTQLSPAIVENQ